MRCRSTEKQPQQGNTPDSTIRYLLTTSHLPFLTLKIVSSPFVKSPFLSNSMSAVIRLPEARGGREQPGITQRRCRNRVAYIPCSGLISMTSMEAWGICKCG